MALNSLDTEVILNAPRTTVGYFHLDRNIQPGGYLEIEGQTYLVLERKHRYLLNSGRYRLDKMTLYVQKSHVSAERQLLDGRWVIGDVTCLYNAHSEILRCAVNPVGPCDRCGHYQPLPQLEELEGDRDSD